MFATWSHRVPFLHHWQGGKEGGFLTRTKMDVFSPYSHLVLTVSSVFPTDKEEAREDFRLIPCSHHVLTVSYGVRTVFAPYCVLFLHHWKGGREGGFLTNIKMDAFLPRSHLVLTMFSPRSLNVPTMFEPCSHYVLFLLHRQRGREGVGSDTPPPYPQEMLSC